MGTTRLEAFSDAVIAIILTIMVLEMRAPHETDIASLRPLIPVFLSYVLSYIYLGIYWSNHHHMIHVTEHVTGGVLWANLHLLFWLSLVPFVTAWMGENGFAPVTMALYGFVMLMAAVAYTVLVRVILAAERPDSVLAAAIGTDAKGYLSLAMYAAGIAFSFVDQRLAGAMYVGVALIWLVPDRRIERSLASAQAPREGGDAEPAEPPVHP